MQTFWLLVLTFLLVISTSVAQQNDDRRPHVQGAPDVAQPIRGDSQLDSGSDVPALTPRVQRAMHITPLLVAERFRGTVSDGNSLWVPDGWGVQIFHAGNLVKPRFLAWDPDSVVHVADPGANSVFALPDRNRDGIADTSIVAADNVEAHDVKFFRGAMYAAEMTRVLKLIDVDRDGYYETRTTFIDSLPSGGHVTRTIVFDTVRNVIYVSVGSASNASRDSVQGVVYEFQLDGSGRRIFATGVRNAVGMAQHPLSASLWATNNGQDNQGDDIPPEWISHVRDGGFHGYPIAYSDGLYFDFQRDDQYRRLLPITSADTARVRSMTRPAATVIAHSAPMAIEFANDGMPVGYRSGAFVALHGSWNRTVATGNKIVYFEFNNGLDSIPVSMSFVMAADTAEEPSRIWWMRPCGLESDGRGNVYFTSDRDEMPLVGILFPRPLRSNIDDDAVTLSSLGVHPNPTSVSASISFELHSDENCSLVLYDALGALAMRVVNTRLPAGAHTFDIDTRSIPTGMYQVRLAAGERVALRNLVVQH